MNKWHKLWYCALAGLWVWARASAKLHNWVGSRAEQSSRALRGFKSACLAVCWWAGLGVDGFAALDCFRCRQHLRVRYLLFTFKTWLRAMPTSRPTCVFSSCFLRWTWTRALFCLFGGFNADVMELSSFTGLWFTPHQHRPCRESCRCCRCGTRVCVVSVEPQVSCWSTARSSDAAWSSVFFRIKAP